MSNVRHQRPNRHGDPLKSRTINVVASAIGLVVLVGMVSVAAGIFFTGRNFWFSAIAGNLFAVPTAIATWNGALWRDSQNETRAQPTWRDWIGIFFVGAAVSGLFVAIDVAVVHPGLSLVFTIGALALSFVALPSALRAWVLEQLLRRHIGRDE